MDADVEPHFQNKGFLPFHKQFNDYSVKDGYVSVYVLEFFIDAELLAMVTGFKADGNYIKPER